MKFVCQSSNLLHEIELANNFSSSKNSLSIASNVLLETSNDKLTIKATDQRLGFTTSINAMTVIPGSTTVFCEKLTQLLKNIPDTEIEIDDSEGSLMIRPADGSDSFQASIKTIEASKYPQLQELEDSFYFSITQRDFFDMIDKTSFAVSSEDDTRHFLTGVYMEKKGDDLVLVATDGKRMAYVCRHFEQEIPDFPSAIIPVRFLNLVKTMGTGEGLLSLGVKEGYIFSRIGNRTVYSTLIGGNYPAYEKVIPRNLEHTCIVKKEDIEKAISFISIFVESKSKRLFADLEENKMKLSAENTEFGESQQIINASYSDESVRMSFNSQLLITPIKKIDSEYISIRFLRPSSAMIFTAEPEKDYLYVLMPMQLS